MNVSEYEFRQDEAWERLKEPANKHPGKLDRLFDAIESFVINDTEHADCVDRSADGTREVYVVPPRIHLVETPDAACLLLVDHGRRTIDLVAYYDVYDGRHPAEQRLAFERMAKRAIEGDSRSSSGDD